MSTQKERVKPADQPTREGEIKADLSMVEKGKHIAEQADELIQEIDELLEHNAAEFVRHYVQRSGE